MHMMLVMSVLLTGASNDLAGRVCHEDDTPLEGATVYVYTAAMKTGTSVLCPSCYSDCGKTARSDAAGAFRIESLDPQLIFRILVVAEGYEPQFVEKVNPSSGPIEAKLKRLEGEIDPARMLRGRVVDARGNPVATAVVSPYGYKDAERRGWGGVQADPLAVTNARGEFVIHCKKPDMQLDLQVQARGLATRNFTLLRAGQTMHELQLGEGVTVTGRLLKDGKPLAGHAVGLVQKERWPETFVGPYEIGTDETGRFAFTNVAPNDTYVVYGLMKSLGAQGATGVMPLSVGADGMTADAGDMHVGAAHTVRGQLVLSDGKPMPRGTRVLLSRDEAWDSLTVETDAEGNFIFPGVPTELVTLSTRVDGYRLSSENASFEPMNATFLMGRVDQDIDNLRVLLEPGPLSRATESDSSTWNRLRSSPLRGAEKD